MGIHQSVHRALKFSVFNMRGPRTFCPRGPNLTFSFKYILVDEGRGDPNTTLSGPSSADNGATVNAGFDCSFVIFRGSRPVLLRNPIFCDFFFRGGGVRTPCHLSGSAHILSLKIKNSRYCRLSRRGECSLRHQLIGR